MSKPASLSDVMPRIRTFCNYRDRCHKEVKDKLYQLGLWKRDVDQAITQLIEENLLNEERYARSFVRGHFYNKKWGRRKIELELRSRHIHTRLIAMAMEEIDSEDYTQTLEKLIVQKTREYKGNKYEKKQKISRFLMQKGYSYGEFADLLKEE